jgi:hypothetical protein
MVQIGFHRQPNMKTEDAKPRYKKRGYGRRFTRRLVTALQNRDWKSYDETIEDLIKAVLDPS